MAATRRKDIVGNYKHPLYLTLLGALIVVIMAAASFSNIGNFVSKLIC